jgi:DivIVA domain-containing protein
VALDRQSIEKKDFPIGRRGYDPDAVDAHLAALADQIEELRRNARRRTETLASAASEQVRAIVEAAEQSAAQIQQEAEEEARDIRSEASEEARRVRDQAQEQARDYVGKVSESTAVMLQRVDSMESELNTLVESLRTGANRLNADLQLLEGNLAELTEAAQPRPRFEPESGSRPRIAAVPDPDTTVIRETPAAEEVAPAEADEDVPALEAVDGGGEGDAGDDDAEGARLIALNMALNGSSREETDRYLAENFDLPDREALLDEVYASVEG